VITHCSHLFITKECLGKLEFETDKDAMWAALGISRQRKLKVSIAQEEESCRSGTAWCDEKKEKHSINAMFTNPESFFGRFDRRPGLLLKVLNRHAPVLPLLAREVMLEGESPDNLQIVRS
jgi:hypothetical protein